MLSYLVVVSICDFKSPQIDTTHKTPSTQSAEVLKYYNGINKLCLTFQEVSLTRKNSSTQAVKKRMRDMVKRGLLSGWKAWCKTLAVLIGL